jgi:sugar phosphate isomerase/epimerase
MPPGDTLRAGEIRRATGDAGLAVLSYGSYYKLGNGSPFEPVLATARALHANTIRVWAGTRASAQYSADEFAQAVDDAQAIADMAQAHGIAVAFEYHPHTLTDTGESAAALLRAVDRPNVRTYWQPNPELSHEKNLEELAAVLPWLEHAHVFHWAADGARLPLEEGLPQWRAYIQKIESRGRAMILEFVRDDDPAQCARDAALLRRLCDAER